MNGWDQMVNTEKRVRKTIERREKSENRRRNTGFGCFFHLLLLIFGTFALYWLLFRGPTW